MTLRLLPLLLAVGSALAADATLAPKDLAADLAVARQALEEGHSGVYRYTPKAELDRAFDRAAGQLTRPMTVLEFYRVLAPVVALVRCGHTNTGLPRELEKEMQASVPLLPFEVEVHEGRVFVVTDHSGNGIAGAEILGINGRKTRDLFGVLDRAMPIDGRNPGGRAGRLTRGGFVRGLTPLAGVAAPFRVEYRLAGARKTMAHPGMLDAERAKLTADPPRPVAELEFVEDGRIAVMTIRSFGGFADLERKVRLDQWMNEAFGEILKRGSRGLVLDVRGNGGGQDALGKLLYAHLTDRDFPYYDDLVVNARTFGFAKYLESPVEIPENRVKPRAGGGFHALGHPNLGVQKPAAPHFAGQVVALADRLSFSATGEFLTAFYNGRRGPIVGEETGAAYLGNTSGMTARVALPHTKVRLFVPLMTYYLSHTRNSPPDRGVMPDVAIRNSVADRVAGRDPMRQRAVELARQ